MSFPYRPVLPRSVVAALVMLSCACDPDPYTIFPLAVEDGGRAQPRWWPSDTGRASDAVAGDATPDDADATSTDVCVPSNEGVEQCDQTDNDCNGEVDDVDPQTLQVNSDHCGSCDNPCLYDNAFARCEQGKCALDSCAPGFFDTNRKPSDGCEYNCLVTNAGTEICDDADNDCDGKVDEEFDKQTDPNNCGSCGTRCLFSHASGTCVGGVCQLQACEERFANINGRSDDGCEYRCPQWPAASTEACDGNDNDCDGLIDEELPGVGESCDTGLQGVCAAGTTRCQGGSPRCVGDTTASAEICDGRDNDCDGETDETFDLQRSVLHCGSCNHTCTFAHATPSCAAGVCKLATCVNGYHDLNNAPADGCEHKCQVYPTSAEICNGRDDDCDGQTDEGFDVSIDPNNCGSCGNACSYPHAQAVCSSGTCAMGDCAADYYNINGSPTDGCEYSCIKSNNGTEKCDNLDNDCDGTIDEGFDRSTDAVNCGTCGNKCVFNNAAAVCQGGVCTMSTCTASFVDLNGASADGCEYKCPVYPPVSADTCDGLDNDCDGQTDEDFVPYNCGTDQGLCSFGDVACVGGQEICQNATDPAFERCDNKDNDCDGSVDEDFNKDSDPRYCGENCVECELDHAIASCDSGSCAIAVCLPGYVDLDGNPANGCEYGCVNSGAEICDGEDNDCDGKIDTLDDSLVPLTGNYCATSGECSGASAQCEGSLGWVCQYGSDVQIKTCGGDGDCTNVPCTGGICPGELALEESLCDDKDNDCDGLTDEAFTNKDTACAESRKQGRCQGTGEFHCSTDKTTTTCVITSPGATPTDETCNGIDDDCDGNIDETADDAAGLGAKDTMIHIQRSYDGIDHDFWIYTYEASRPDANATGAGTSSARPCSRDAVLPWANISQTSAAAACASINDSAGNPMRLCTAAEWFVACSGAAVSDSDPDCDTTSNDGCYYPYGDTYVEDACNGNDNDTDSATAGDQDDVLATGSKSGCVSPDGGYDMSGNLREWTSEEQRADPDSADPDGYSVMGGSYDTSSTGLRCDFDFAIFPAVMTLPNLGFRCCSDAQP